ncbi:peptidyl-prolyl cis-trans isomerase, rhodopsin-specific isozyme [Phlebotomus argentipes]|uniref:peptidyl-prolyl cis-trans isomerase, rhodopsin-specific isozyme n=1 Tax=Phlebotomus argentipes TaxID=94469 RepID=UPI002892D0D1|nr:peptidyl-prolyl cis-trans isomerase, rhodopsin-specific isozyme [Phlebotomus argentipes]
MLPKATVSALPAVGGTGAVPNVMVSARRISDKVTSIFGIMKFWKFILFIQCFYIWITYSNAETYKVTSQVFLDVSHDGKDLGRIVIGLFGENSPKTVRNFRKICLKGINGKSYNGTTFHRIIKKFMIQGGDIISGNGQGSASIYGDSFDDENLDLLHSGPGFIGMANRGPNTNGCQFYITTVATPWLNGKHTIFGKVVEGQGIVHDIERVKTNTNDIPVKPVRIVRCGNLRMKQSYTISDDPYDLAAWIKASGVPLGMSFSILAFFHWVIRRLNRYI